MIKAPFGWLRDVWVKGLAITFGQLCLAADETTEGDWRLVMASPDEPPTFAEWRVTRRPITEIEP